MSLEEYMIPCLSKTLFGFDCLGCGLQRALLLVAQGQWRAAFLMYPGVYSFLLLCGALVLFYTTKKTTFTDRLWKAFLVMHLFFVLGGYIYHHL